MDQPIRIRTLANTSTSTAKRTTREQLRRKLAALAAVGAIGLASLAGAGFGRGAAHAQTVQATGFRSISLNQSVAVGQVETVTATTLLPADNVTNLPRIQWGDGSEQVPSVTLVKSGDALTTQLSASHTYQQPGTPVIIVSYFPTTGGAPFNATLPVTVTPATTTQPTAPATITVPTGFRQLTADQQLRVGQAGQLSALTVFAADPNRFASVQWGDGTQMVPSVTNRKAGDMVVSQLSAVHAYQQAGSYTVVLSYFPDTGGGPFTANIQVRVSTPLPVVQPQPTTPTTPSPVFVPTVRGPFEALPFGPLHRLFSGSDHVYTTNADEYAADLQLGYTDEGAAAEIAMAPADGLTPLFRLFDGSHHLYTIDQGEHDSLVAAGATDEGIAGYVWSAPSDGLVPLFRLNVNGDHLYTSDQGEHDRLVAGGATDEGIACFVRVEED